MAADGRPEVVLQYSRHVRIAEAGLKDPLDGAKGLLDIVRLNLSHLRSRMGAPTETYTHVHPETLELTDVPCSHVHHVNLVLRVSYREHGRTVRAPARVRVVLNQTGILRTDVVPLEANAAADPMGKTEPN